MEAWLECVRREIARMNSIDNDLYEWSQTTFVLPHVFLCCDEIDTWPNGSGI